MGVASTRTLVQSVQSPRMHAAMVLRVRQLLRFGSRKSAVLGCRWVSKKLLVAHPNIENGEELANASVSATFFSLLRLSHGHGVRGLGHNKCLSA